MFLMLFNFVSALNVTEMQTLLDNQNQEQRENISYSFFATFLLLITGFLLYLGLKKEENPMLRQQIKKWVYLGLAFFHAYFFFLLFRGYISEQSFWRITYVYGAYIGTFIILILAFIVWEVKEEVMDDPFFWYHNLIRRLQQEKQRKRFEKRK